MKRKSLLFLAMTLVLTTVINLFAGFAVFAADGDAANEIVAEQPTGEGTSENPYQITKAGHLVWIKNHLDSYYKLMESIDLNGATWSALDTFTGVLDGNGYTISDFVLNEESATDSATFINTLGATGDRAVVKNLTFDTVTLSTSLKAHTGVLVGTVIGGSEIDSITVTNLTAIVTGTNTANGFGSVVGCLSEASSVSNCNATATIQADGYMAWNGALGGLVGKTFGSSSVSNCVADGSITGSIYSGYIGGVIGWLDANTSLSYCINRCDIQIDVTTSSKYFQAGGLGGIAYKSTVNIDHCVNEGTIKGSAVNKAVYMGGLIARAQENLNITNSINIGAVSTETAGSYAGGIFGHQNGYSTNITNTYNLGEINAPNKGFIGASQGSSVGGSGTAVYTVGDQSVIDANTIDKRFNAIAETKENIEKMVSYQNILTEVAEHLTGISTDLYGYQTSAEVDGKYNLRLVATISGDYTKCQNVGFEAAVTYTIGEADPITKEATIVSNNLYRAIKATENGADTATDIAAEALGGDYIFVLVCKNLPANAENVTFTVTTFYTDANGDRIYSETKTTTITLPGDNVTSAT